jgi:hypothetical protein
LRAGSEAVMHCASCIAAQAMELATELARVYAVFEGFDAIDKDDRDVVAVLIAQARIFINIDFFKREFIFARPGAHSGLSFIAQAASRSRVERHFGFHDDCHVITEGLSGKRENCLLTEIDKDQAF